MIIRGVSSHINAAHCALQITEGTNEPLLRQISVLGPPVRGSRHGAFQLQISPLWYKYRIITSDFWDARKFFVPDSPSKSAIWRRQRVTLTSRNINLMESRCKREERPGESRTPNMGLHTAIWNTFTLNHHGKSNKLLSSGGTAHFSRKIRPESSENNSGKCWLSISDLFATGPIQKGYKMTKDKWVLKVNMRISKEYFTQKWSL